MEQNIDIYCTLNICNDIIDRLSKIKLIYRHWHYYLDQLNKRSTGSLTTLPGFFSALTFFDVDLEFLDPLDFFSFSSPFFMSFPKSLTFWFEDIVLFIIIVSSLQLDGRVEFYKFLFWLVFLIYTVRVYDCCLLVSSLSRHFTTLDETLSTQETCLLVK